MRNMAKHADNFDWAAGWFRLFYRICFGVAILAIASIALFVFTPKPFAVVGDRVIQRPELITQGVVGLVGSMLSAFIWRTCMFLCEFLRDFANGLAAQQIKREHRAANPHLYGDK